MAKGGGLSAVGVLLICLVGGGLIAGAVLASGALPLQREDGSSRPPCSQLQDRQTVAAVLASKQDMVARFQAVGPGVSVDISTPCKDLPDRAIVRITYATDAEREGVEAIINTEVLGAAIELVKK